MTKEKWSKDLHNVIKKREGDAAELAGGWKNGAASVPCTLCDAQFAVAENQFNFEANRQALWPKIVNRENNAQSKSEHLGQKKKNIFMFFN